MSQNYPIADPGVAGWLTYSFWDVTYTNRQGQVNQAVVFAPDAPSAIVALESAINLNVFGPLTNVSASPSQGTGFSGGGPDPNQASNTP
jgi:hypothetical protein